MIIIKKALHLGGCKFKVASDRIEAGSYMMLATAVNVSKIKLKRVSFTQIEAITSTIKKLGLDVKIKKDTIRLKKNKTNAPLKQIVADVYPHFPTDLQPILTVCLLKSSGVSHLKDNVYPKRISHLEEIKKAGGKVIFDKEKIIIYPSHLSKNTFYAHDLRCGFACIVLATIASGKSIIDNLEVVLRGYEKLTKKLKKLKIKVKKIND